MEQYEREHLNELREKMAANEREHRIIPTTAEGAR